MATTKKAKEEGVQATTALIEAFQESLASSSQTLVSSRCVSHSNLVDLVLQAREIIDSPILREHSGVQLIRLLEDAAVVHPVPLTRSPSKKLARLYTIGFNTTTTAIPPAELLQAHAPKGILCYFTAIELHALTTQPAPHYHIATLRAPPQKPRDALPKDFISADSPLPLGVLQFFIEDTAYYSTSRDPSNLLGTQRRQLNPYCIVTLTNLEQTLLDCLHRPGSSGGAAVVFEAWEQGLQRTTPEKLLALALQIGDETLLRRTGYMIERYRPDASALSELKRLAACSLSQNNIPTLLPGIPYQQINTTWCLRTP